MNKLLIKKRRFTNLLLSFLILLLGANISRAQNTVVNFTTSGTWTCPVGVTSIQVEAWGGGGGGAGAGSSTNFYTGGGGAGGNYSKNTSITVVPGTIYTITVGAGGAAGGTSGTANNVIDLNGGTSSFGTLLYSSGGQGGAGGLTAIKQGIGGGNAGILAYTFTAGSGYSITPTVTVGTAWTASANYTLNQQYFNAGKLYTVTTAGTSGTVAPTHTSGDVQATGGTAIFTYAGLAATAVASTTGTSPNKTVSSVLPVITGSGYLTTPIVTLSSGNATATATSPSTINVTGSTFYALGGSGGNGTYTATSTSNSSGGGGASGGPLGIGNNGVGVVGGTSASGSGAGANGTATNSTAGTAATEVGGGGSGAVGVSKAGGAGAPGKIVITYASSIVTLTAPVATASTLPTQTGFTATWGAVTNASNYSLYLYNANTQSNIVGWTFPLSGTTLTADITSASNLTNTLVQSSGTVNTAAGATTQAISAASWWSTPNKYWEVPVNTTGYYNVNVSSKIYSTAPKDFKLQYKIGAGGAYTDVTNGAFTCATDWTTGVLNNLTLPAECNNQTSVYLRWINYTNIDFSTGLAMTGGTARLDDIYVKGALLTQESGYPITVSGTSQVLTNLDPGIHYYNVVALGNGSTYLDSVKSNLITSSIVPIPQAIADYKSIGDVSLSNIANWQYFDGISWNTATIIPTGNNNITISTGNAVALGTDFTVGTGKTMTVNGTINLVGHVVSGAGSFILNSGASLKLGDNTSLATAVTATTTTLSPGANYYYDGTIAQHTGGLPNSVAGSPSAANGSVTYTATLTGSITVSNTTGVTMQQAIKINSPGTLTVKSTGKLLFGDGEVASSTQNSGTLNSGSYNFNGTGNFIAETGCTLSITSSKGISTGIADGNIRNSGTRTFNTGINYIFAKNDLFTPISIGTSFGSEINASTGINNLTINDPYGVFLASSYTTTLVGTANTASAATTSTYTSGVDITVNGTLNMISGKLFTSDYVTVATNSATAVTINLVDYFPTSSTVITPGTTNTKTITIGSSGSISGAGNTKWIVGNLAKQTASGSSPSFTYAIGDATNYYPLAITFTGTTSATGGLTASTISGIVPSISDSGLDTSKKVNRYWSLTNSGLTGFGTFQATFNYAVSENDDTTSVSNYVVRRYDNATWSATTSSGTPTTTSTTATEIAGFGNFAIGKINTTSAPTATAQVFCGTATVANLVATGTAINWYSSDISTTPLASTQALATGNYYASQTVNGIESSRTVVSITVNTTPAPTASAQTFCNAATVANLTAPGTALNWYSGLSGGTALDSTTALSTGTYYVSQTLNSCESSRISVVITINPNITYYADTDNDGYGAIATTQNSCTGAPSGYVTNNTDCDDTSATIYRSALLYTDADGDGYDAGSATICYGASLPTGKSLTTSGSDCDDTNAAINASFSFYADADHDTYGTGNLVSVCAVNSTTPPTGYSVNNTDCNDTNAAINASFSFYVDADHDTYGTGSSVSVCAVNSTTPPTGYSVNATDCDDTSATIYRSALLYTDADGDGYDAGSATICYGASLPTGKSLTTSGSDCDDTNAAKWRTGSFYVDADGDHYTIGTAVTLCYGATTPSGYSVTTLGTDCDDTSATIYRSALLYTDADGDGYDAGSATICYGASLPTGKSLTTLGSDCDDTNAAINASFSFYADADHDTYGTGNLVSVCAVNSTTPPTGYSVNNTDCNDINAAINASFSFYVDADHDTYGTGSSVSVCAVNSTTPPTGYSVNATDCDDTSATIYRSALLYTDADGDGYDAGSATICYGASLPTGKSLTTSGSDCDDTNAAKWRTGSFYVDADGDNYTIGTAVTLCYGATTPSGYSATTLGTDCDDTSATIYRSALLYTDADGDGYDAGSATICYGASLPAGKSLTTLGSDCNDTNAAMHSSYNFYVDADHDTYGTGSSVSVCAINSTTPPTGYSVNNTDCDDTSATIYRSALLYSDADGDGYDAGSATICYGANLPTGKSLTTSGSDCDDTNAAKWRTGNFYVDADGDHYTIGTAVSLCYGATTPSGYSATTLGTDCDDTSATIYRSALLYTDADGDGYDAGSATICYGANLPTGKSLTTSGSDCDDTSAAKWRTSSYYVDGDGDNYTIGIAVSLCYGATTPSGYSATTLGTDCDDTSATIYRSALLYTDADGDGYDAGSATICYGANLPAGKSLTTLGSDCDDTNAAKWRTGSFYVDADGDHYTIGAAVSLCYGISTPTGYSATTLGTDCDDTNIAKWRTGTFYVDADGDGYTIGSTVSVCYGTSTPSGYSATTLGTDCDDTNIAKWRTGSFYVDADGDHYTLGSTISLCYGTNTPTGYSATTLGTDCDDTNIAKWRTGTFYVDADGDGYTIGSTVSVCYGTSTPSGYAATSLGTDCDDTRANTHPGAVDVCNDGIDNDCNGIIDNIGMPGGCTPNGAPIVSNIIPSQCGTTLNLIDDQVYAALVANAQGYRWKITKMIGLVASTNPADIQTIDTSLRVFKFTQLVSYAFDTTYQVEVSVKINNYWQPYYGSACTVKTPATTTKIVTTTCGTTLSLMTDIVYADLVNYTSGYRFKVTNLLTNNVQIIDRSLREFRFNLLTNSTYSTPYKIEVAVKNTNGTYMSYGTSCTVNTPLFPTTSLQDSQCDYTAASASEMIYANLTANATIYRFNVTNSQIGYNYTFDKVLRAFALNTVPGLTPNTTYSIKVAVQIGGVWGPYGKICTLTTPGVGKQEVTKETLSLFDATTYPNPFAENFKLEISTNSEETLQVKVYDMLGKLIENHILEATEFKGLEVGANYPSGVYNVIVSQGDSIKTLRVIKR